jgi:transposase
MIGPESVRVYVVVGNVDMRKSIDGLSQLVKSQFGLNPLGGHLFAFSNRHRTMVKLLYWDRNGFCLWIKRLERERFRWPSSPAEVLEIGPRELRWLLDGLDLSQGKAHRSLSYSTLN